MNRATGNATLFPNAAKSRFITISRQRYDSMQKRLTKKKIPMAFTIDQLRVWLLEQLGGFDGAVKCHYCSRLYTLEECALDHKLALVRGGSPGLDNLDLICAADNDRKGAMTPAEYMVLLAFLETKLPLARIDVLKRLGQAVKLAAGARRNATLLRDLKQRSKDNAPATAEPF